VKILVLTVALFLQTPSGAETGGGHAEVLVREFEAGLSSEGEIAAEIGEMYGREQYARFAIIQLLQRDDLTDEDRVFVGDHAGAIIDVMDRTHTERLEEILEAYTWSDLAGMQGQTIRQAFILIQHADLETQLSWLPEIQRRVGAGDLSGSSFALLSDRVALGLGQMQQYGTQIICEGGEWLPENLSAPETVDERRSELGLGPMDEYMESYVALYGECRP
jgi:hypothetical protein